MRPRRDCKILSMGVSRDLAQWIDAEAQSRGMNRNQFLNYTLQMARECQTVDRICRLEKRVLALEEAGPFAHCPKPLRFGAAP